MKRKWHFLVPLFCFEYMLFEIISRKFVCLIGVKPLLVTLIDLLMISFH